MSTEPQPDRVADEVETKNVANILTKLQAGKVLSAAEKQQVADWRDRQSKEEDAGKIPARLHLNPRQARFAALVATGMHHAEAYRTAYKRGVTPQRAAERGSRLAAHPAVEAEISRLRGKTEAKVLLTLNDRLAILAEIAQGKRNRAGDRTRAIDVYSRISGDQAPERHEVAGPNGGAIPVDATASVSIARVPIRRRMELMREARMREARKLAAEKEAKL